MCRSAVSIPSNIAEGRKRGTRKDFRQLLLNAYGSGGELETQVEIAKKLHYGKEQDRRAVERELTEVMRMLNTMISKLGTDPKKLIS
jgi:four helix bundle protein